MAVIGAKSDLSLAKLAIADCAFVALDCEQRHEHFVRDSGSPQTLFTHSAQSVRFFCIYLFVACFGVLLGALRSVSDVAFCSNVGAILVRDALGTNLRFRTVFAKSSAFFFEVLQSPFAHVLQMRRPFFRC